MADLAAIPLGNYAAGSYNFGPIDIADSVTRCDFKVARCTTADPTIWPLATVALSVQLEVSVDGGAWVGQGGFSAVGGIANTKVGAEATHSIGGGNFPAGVNRRVRGSVTITGGTLRSSATVQVT